ncbi:hypothetical protein EHN07_12070 [Buttiauxella warmboldiae]|uniref:Uncharacterized protein n=1 Tax=Buttiauxella warmboldiae TaxID=82993 RepID=A0A3N5DCK0_9ENTR|nr:hypothetical protein EHN07_12070 [Buttiauxella warmboldiae]
MFDLDHESPSLQHEQIALEEYTVPAHYGGVNIQTSKVCRLSSRKGVGCTHESESLTDVSSSGFAPWPPTCNSKSIEFEL